MKFILLLAFVISFISKAFGEELVDGAGIAVHIRQEFFDNLKDSILKEFVKSIETGKLDDFVWSHDFAVANQTLFKVFLNMTNIQRHNFQLDTSTSFLKLTDTAPYLELFISNFSMRSTFDFHFGTDPYFLDDFGQGYLNFEPTSLYLGYDIQNVNGKPQFVAREAVMNNTGLKIEMNGTADFSRVISQMGSFLEDAVEHQINDYLLGIVGSGVTPLINSALSNVYNTTYNISESLVANFSSSVEPRFSESVMTLFFKGEVRPMNEDNVPFIDELNVPATVNAEGKQLQVVISEFMFNSAIYSMFQAEYLNINTQDFNGSSIPINASTFFLIFPALADKYAADDKIFFKAVAHDTTYKPYMRILDGITTGYIDFDIEMFSDKETLFKLKANCLIEVDFIITKGFYLTVDMKMFRLRVREILINNIDKDLDDRDIAAFFGLFSGFSRNYINKLVRDLKINLPIGDNLDLDDVSMRGEDFYIYADITPRISLFSPEEE